MGTLSGFGQRAQLAFAISKPAPERRGWYPVVGTGGTEMGLPDIRNQPWPMCFGGKRTRLKHFLAKFCQEESCRGINRWGELRRH